MDRYSIMLNKEVPEVPEKEIIKVNQSLLVVKDLVIPVDILDLSLSDKSIEISMVIKNDYQRQKVLNSLNVSMRLKFNVETEEEIVKWDFIFVVTYAQSQKLSVIILSGVIKDMLRVRNYQ